MLISKILSVLKIADTMFCSELLLNPKLLLDYLLAFSAIELVC